MHCTRHRVFLACLIVAAKYLNDSSPKNRHWTKYAALFSLAEVNLMVRPPCLPSIAEPDASFARQEKQLLYLLDYDLRMDEETLIDAFAPFLPASSVPAKPAVEPVHVPATPKRTPSKERPAMPLTPSPSPVRLPVSVPPSSSELAPRASSSRHVSPVSSCGSSSGDMLTPDTGSTDEDEEMADYEAAGSRVAGRRRSPTRSLGGGAAPYARPAARTSHHQGPASSMPITPNSLEGSPVDGVASTTRAADFAAAAKAVPVPVLRSQKSGTFWSAAWSGLRRDAKGNVTVAPVEIAS